MEKKHQPCCKKLWRNWLEPVIVIFSSCWRAMKELIGCFENLFHFQSVCSATVLNALCIVWRPHDSMSISPCCWFSSLSCWVSYKNFRLTFGPSIPTWNNLLGSRSDMVLLNCFWISFDAPWPKTENLSV